MIRYSHDDLSNISDKANAQDTEFKTVNIIKNCKGQFNKKKLEAYLDFV